MGSYSHRPTIKQPRYKKHSWIGAQVHQISNNFQIHTAANNEAYVKILNDEQWFWLTSSALLSPARAFKSLLRWKKSADGG